MAAEAPRTGTVVPLRVGEKWAVEVRLEEHGRRHSVLLNRTFVTESAAREAGDHAVAEWLGDRLPTRDLLLQELAAVYRRLRATYKTMQPSTVPATRSAWDHATKTWEALGWIAAGDAARYRDHVDRAFTSASGTVRRHTLRLDPETDSA